jgi:hypothetical protein
MANKASAGKVATSVNRWTAEVLAEQAIPRMLGSARQSLLQIMDVDSYPRNLEQEADLLKRAKALILAPNSHDFNPDEYEVGSVEFVEDYITSASTEAAKQSFAKGEVGLQLLFGGLANRFSLALKALGIMENGKEDDWRIIRHNARQIILLVQDKVHRGELSEDIVRRNAENVFKGEKDRSKIISDILGVYRFLTQIQPPESDYTIGEWLLFSSIQSIKKQLPLNDQEAFLKNFKLVLHVNGAIKTYGVRPFWP